MRRHQPAGRVTNGHRFTGRRATPRLAPEVIQRTVGAHDLRPSSLDDITLQGRMDHQSRWPIRKQRAERDMQLVKHQTVAVRSPIRRGQPTRHPHIVLTAVRVHTLIVLATMPVHVVLGAVRIAMLRFHDRAADCRQRSPSVGQLAPGIVERCGYGARLEQMQPRPRRRDLLPDAVGEGRQPRTERPGDNQDIGICRARRGRPPPLPQFPFHSQPDASTTRHFDQQHVRAGRSNAQ